MELENTNDSSLSVEDMRTARHSANSIFIKFTSDYRFFGTHAFCFYEGEDGKYYNLRIRKYFNSSFLTYTVGNKKEVLKLFNKIKRDSSYDSIIKMFFIDRDYDTSLHGTDEDLYETPCYSVENFYANKECFEYILQAEFGLNISDNDYNKCIKDFELRFNEFNNLIMEFNSLVLLRRKKSDSNSNFQFGSIKTSHLINCQIAEIKKSNKYHETIKYIMDTLNICTEELNNCKNEIFQRGSFQNQFRGKNQFDFMIALLNDLKNLNNNSSYFSEKLNCVKLNITSNRLSELSQYAITPQCLDLFIENHNKKFA